jgi:hypothetical protein
MMKMNKEQKEKYDEIINDLNEFGETDESV